MYAVDEEEARSKWGAVVENRRVGFAGWERTAAADCASGFVVSDLSCEPGFVDGEEVAAG